MWRKRLGWRSRSRRHGSEGRRAIRGLSRVRDRLGRRRARRRARALQEVFPGDQPRADEGPDVDAMLAELDARIRVPDEPGGERLYGLAPVATVATRIFVKAQRGEAETDEAL